MGKSKIPGVVGKGGGSQTTANRGPMCFIRNDLSGLLSPRNALCYMNTLEYLIRENLARLESEKDEKELKLVVKLFGNIRNSAGTSGSYVFYKYSKKTRQRERHYKTFAYANDRNSFFGSRKDYLAYLHVAKKELNENGEILRRLLEPPKARRKKHSDWKDAQDVFYAWVRKAYEKHFAKSNKTVDIPKLIKSGKSDKLKKALAQVQADYGNTFKAGGFNPRPMKIDGNYRFGSLSEHGLGTAIDIESGSNAHINTATWKRILTFTGKTSTTANRKTQWTSTPQTLHTTIVEINDEFVSKLKQAKKDAVEAAKGKAEKANASDADKNAYEKAQKEPLEAAMNADPALKSIGKSFLTEWQNGFFNLPWALVKELHDEAFTWGAVFSHPDLHHFEL